MSNLYGYKITKKIVNGMPYEEYKKLVEKGVEMYKNGMTTQQIADDLGVHRTTVRKWINKSNVQFRERRIYPLEKIDAMLEEYETTDIRVQDLAIKYGMPYQYCRHTIYLYGGERSIRHKPNIIKGVLVVQLTQDMKIVDVYPSIKKASEKTNIDKADIWKVVNKCKDHKSAGGYKWMKLNEYLGIS